MSRITRTTVLRCTSALVSAGLAATALTAVAAAPAQAASSKGGKISRSEVIARAQYWVNQGVPYNQSGYYTDGAGTNYREDCSGYVSMAWHATDSYNTWTLPSISSEIGKTSMLPGDALNYTEAHVILFGGWQDKAAGTFTYYAEQNSSVLTNKYTANINSSSVAGWPTNLYKALRYNNITDDTSGDLTGDGKADLVALESDGSITAADGTGNGFTNYHKIASGFGLHASADRLNYVDADGDGKADLIGLETNGTLTLATGTGSGFTNYHTISSGYGEYVNNSRLKFADVTGDGKADAIAVESNGSLTLAVGTGNGFTNFHNIATGFGEYVTGSRLKFADVTGDGKADAIALENNGSLTLAVSNGDGFSNYHTISSGYGDFVNNDRLRFGDITGDGKADILAVETDGSLTLGTGTGDGFKDFHKVATGFGTYVNDHRLQLAG